MIPVTFDGNNINDGTNYDAYFVSPAFMLPEINPQLLQRPGAWPRLTTIQRPEQQLEMEIIIRGSTVDTLRRQLFRWFDPESETAKKLIIADDDNSLQRYVMIICKSFKELKDSAGLVFRAILKIDGDVRRRGANLVNDTWNITASGQTRTINNAGEDEAYPVFTIRPTSNKTAGFAYKRWIPIRWTADVGAQNHPLDLTSGGFDTAALVTAGKMQADGDDLRIYINGLEVDRWLAQMNAATTKVWSNLNFSANQEVTLEVAIASTGAVTTIDVNEDISGFPSSGILMIDSEAFSYTNKNNQLKRFSGVTRAVNGTSMAAHSVGATIWWVQNDVWMYYGDSTLSAPNLGKFQPIFDLTASSNTFWDYQNFGESAVARPGAWSSYTSSGAETYTGDQGGSASPFDELGVHILGTIEGAGARWSLFNPFGITSAIFQNGEKRVNSTALITFRAYIRSSTDGSSWFTEYQIPAPSAASTWEIWSRNETLNSGSKYLAIELAELNGSESYVESSRVEVTMTAGPTVTVNAEQSNYQLNATITNVTTSDAIIVTFNMGLNNDLKVDTDKKTVTYLADGSSQFQAVTLAGGPRRAWLSLARGDNTLRFDDTGTAGVTITTEWETRYHD